MKKHKNLQPWLDYFEMLHTYEEKGFLQVEAEKHEAYVTEPALYTLAGCSFSAREKGMRIDAAHTMTQVGHLVRRLRVYAAWRSQGASSYDSHAFAVHMVKPDEPHDLLHTIILTTRRPWWKLWMKHDHFEVISYAS